MLEDLPLVSNENVKQIILENSLWTNGSDDGETKRFLELRQEHECGLSEKSVN